MSVLGQCMEILNLTSLAWKGQERYSVVAHSFRVMAKAKNYDEVVVGMMHELYAASSYTRGLYHCDVNGDPQWAQEQIDAARMKFIGDIKQHPPKYSAIKIKGKRAFDYARSDEEIELKARDIHIEDFKINTERFPELDFEVVCSKGTYIRSLAHDFGRALGNGACLKSLRRTRIGDFKVEDAWQLEDLKNDIITTG